MDPQAIPVTAPPIRRQMGAGQWALLVGLSLLWGGSFFFNGVAVRSLPPLTVVWVRVALAAVILMALCRVAGVRLPRDRRVWAAFAVMGLFNNVIPFSLIVWGQAHIASGLAAILNATTPLFAVVLAHLATRDERMSAGRVAGVGLGLIGVAVMIGGQVPGGIGSTVWAHVAVLGAALSYAVAAIFGRRFSGLGLSPLATASGQIGLSALILCPLMLWADRPWLLPLPPAAVPWSLVGLAALCTALAYLIYFRLLATAGATNLLLVTFLVPVSAILLGIGVLGETLEPRHLTGMALIGAGLASIDGRLPAWLGGWLAGPVNRM